MIKWRWDLFVCYGVLLIYTGWLGGFMVPYGVGLVLGGLVGLVAGLFRWFEDEPYIPPQR